MTQPQKKSAHPVVSFIDRHAILFSFLVFIGIFIVGDRLLNEYFLPDAKGIENSYYHHGLRKNYHGTVSWGAEKHPLYTNDLGFKDSRCRTVPRSTEKHRILFIGDSFTEGAGLPFEQTFVGMFRQAVPEDDVLNAGVVSFSPKLYYYRLKYLMEVEKLQFDELFVFIDISDINDEIEYSVYTPVEESFLRRTDSWLRSISFTYKVLRNSLLNVEKNELLQWLIKHVDARKPVHTVSNMHENAGAELPEKAVTQANKSKKRNSKDLPQVVMPSDFREKRVEERPRWTFDKVIYEKWGHAGLELAEYHMDLVVRLMQEKNIPITIAVYPWPDQIREGDQNSIQEAHWKQFSLEHGVGFISYFSDFMAGEPEATIHQYFIPGDVHWNEEGHDLVFRKLFNYYQSKPHQK